MSTPTVAVDLSVAAGPNLGRPLTDIEAHNTFDEINVVLGGDEDAQAANDVPCELRLGLDSSVGVYPLAVLDSSTKLQAAVNDTSADIKVVSLISSCGTFVYDALDGCAMQGKTAVVVRKVGAVSDLDRTREESSLWLHEYGHVQGLGDYENFSDSKSIMDGATSATRRNVTTPICQKLLPP